MIRQDIGDATLLRGDCLERMAEIESGSVDLVVVDPPYNIGKDKNWDKWATQEAYVEWLGSTLVECQRILKGTGSFYFFHNDFLQVVKIQNWISTNTGFIFKQFLTWNKRYAGSPRKFYFDNIIQTSGDRNYRSLVEYCLFYTFQDETGLTTINKNRELYKIVKDYMFSESEKWGATPEKLAALLDRKTLPGMYPHYFSNCSQWHLPTKKVYEKLQTTSYFNRSYESLQQEYESLRQEYESLRYTFNHQKTHHSVWDYEIAPKAGHTTPKPVELIENIILHSSNPGDLVLDFTMGSGTTGVACMQTGRRFIGIERDENYFNIACGRILEAYINAVTP